MYPRRYAKVDAAKHDRTGIETIPNGIQKHQKSMLMGSNIHAKSMKSRGCVADAILERFGSVSGGARRKRTGSFWTPVATIFGQKSKKRKKNQYGHRALSRSAPRTQKKRFLRGAENVLFFGWFFH